MPEGSIVEGALCSVIIVTIVILLFIWSDSHPRHEHLQPNCSFEEQTNVKWSESYVLWNPWRALLKTSFLSRLNASGSQHQHEHNRDCRMTMKERMARRRPWEREDDSMKQGRYELKSMAKTHHPVVVLERKRNGDEGDEEDKEKQGRRQRQMYYERNNA